MNEQPSSRKISSPVLGGVLFQLGLLALIASVFWGLVMINSSEIQPPWILGTILGFFVAIACLASAQRLLPQRRVSIIAVVTGIVAFVLFAPVVPGLVTAPGRSKQKRTMADMRSIATAVEAYAVDHANHYPNANDLDELSRLITPTYIRTLPRLDGWNHPYRFQHLVSADGTEDFILGSAGKDGKWEKRSLSDYTAQATTDYDNDIISRPGEFIQYPEGIQAN